MKSKQLLLFRTPVTIDDLGHQTDFKKLKQRDKHGSAVGLLGVNSIWYTLLIKRP